MFSSSQGRLSEFRRASVAFVALVDLVNLVAGVGQKYPRVLAVISSAPTGTGTSVNCGGRSSFNA